MNDSVLARVGTALTSLSIGAMGQTAGQRGNKESAANQESTDSQQDTEVSQPFADVDLLFESEKNAAKQPVSALQSFADFIVVHNLSSHVPVVPSYHGPKLIKLASLVANSSD